MTRRRTRAAASAILAVTIAVSLLAGCRDDGGSRDQSGSGPGAAAGSDAAQARHRSLLTELADRLIPASDGGWVVAAIDDSEAEAPDRWVLAAIAGAHPDAARALVAALDAALLETGGDHELARRAGQAVALGLADPEPPAVDVATGRAVDLAERAIEELRAGRMGWLGVVLNLALVRGPAGERARQQLQAMSGTPRCDRLPGPGDPLPSPDGILTVPLRLLAASGVRCGGAVELAARALEDGAWSAPIAAGALADLFTVAAEVPPSLRDRVSRQLVTRIDPEGPEVVDLAVALLLRRLAAAIDRPLTMPEHVALRLRNVAARHGALPDRSSSPTTALDVAAIRQLHGTGLVSPEVQAAARASVDRDGAPLPAVVTDLLIDGQGPGCDEQLPPPGRVSRSIGTALGEVVVEVGRLHCAGELRWATIRDLIEGGRADEAPVRAWAAVLAACHLDPEAFSPANTLDLELRGPFRDDPVWLLGAAMAAAPHVACDAERHR